MSKSMIVRTGIVLFFVVIVGVGLRYSGPVMARIGTEIGVENRSEAPSVIEITRSETLSSDRTMLRPASQVSSSISGAKLTQTFTLQGGWNSIYLEVEPINNSPLQNVGTAEEPIMVHELSTIEAVFADLSCGDCLESVWTWNVPLTTVDYIVDPSEGLWDEPGWKRYFPEHNLGPDGASRSFLTNLLSLHANTGYLVKLKDGMGAATLVVEGRPVVEHHHWLANSYNLAGFPIDPNASPQPTVASFFQNLKAGPSPISEVRYLLNDGTWSGPLSAGDSLNYGEAYLVYFDSSDPDTATDYTAPLEIISMFEDGLEFTPGFSGNQQSFRVANLAATDITVELALIDTNEPAVALTYDSDPQSDTDPYLPLWPGSAQRPLGAGKPAELEFVVSSAEQNEDGEALLEVRSPELGVRWLVPVTALRGDHAGLWIGEVVANDVSEGRLGGTNVEDGELTIALRSHDLSGIQGAAELSENPDGNTASVAIMAAMTVPVLEEPVVREPISGTAPYVTGYVYVDSDQNGQPDAGDKGFAGVTVHIASMKDNFQKSTQTVKDGSYLFEGLPPGVYTLWIDPSPPIGYTAAFDVTEPAPSEGATPITTPNRWPTTLEVDAQGITWLYTVDDNQQQRKEDDFPRYNAQDERIEPQLSFGFVPIYDASLWTGQCGEGDSRQWRRDLAPVVNGVLDTTIDDAALNPEYTVSDALLGPTTYSIYIEEHGAGGTDGKGIACGEIVVGAPTRFENGDGSDFRFRVLLRVDENGGTELLPDYATTAGKRISSAAFSIAGPVSATGAAFGNTSKLMNFTILVESEDPLNPFKHRFHPDHDNLDVKFNPIELDTVPEYLWESYEVRRRIQLELTELPPIAGATELTAAELDWGGGVWGGQYKEVIGGIHKNDITVKGYFVIRHALSWEDLTPQAYDQTGGGGG